MQQNMCDNLTKKVILSTRHAQKSKTKTQQKIKILHNVKYKIMHKYGWHKSIKYGTFVLGDIPSHLGFTDPASWN